MAPEVLAQDGAYSLKADSKSKPEYLASQCRPQALPSLDPSVASKE
tara:strand:- start:393 stop:530 length:138 start_codon:yes stop_codon:yes gene_type:complete